MPKPDQLMEEFGSSSLIAEVHLSTATIQRAVWERRGTAQTLARSLRKSEAAPHGQCEVRWVPLPRSFLELAPFPAPLAGELFCAGARLGLDPLSCGGG